jgi:hypothetical protein
MYGYQEKRKTGTHLWMGTGFTIIQANPVSDTWQVCRHRVG